MPMLRKKTSCTNYQCFHLKPEEEVQTRLKVSKRKAENQRIKNINKSDKPLAI